MITSHDLFMEERESNDRENDYASYYPEVETLPVDDLPDSDSFKNITVTSITPSKANVSLLAKRIHQQVRDGQVDPIEAAIHLNATKKMCEEALKLIRNEVVTELDRNSVKLSKYGCKVERAEVATEYDYTTSAEWLAFKATELEAIEERKKIETELRSIGSGKIKVDNETGEVMEGVNKVSTTSFKVTLAK